MNRSIPLVLAVALFMEQMDSTVISTSLPAIAADIGTSPVALKLALTAYLVSLAIFIPISGWMAERYGAKQVFRAAIGVFILGSVACAFSRGLDAFVAARFVQGVGGAMMTPVGRLVLVRSTQKSELVSAMAWLTIPALVGPLVGPPIGGFISTYLTWHWIFLINVPIGAAGILFATLALPPMPGRDNGRPDVRGLLLSGTAAAGIVFGLSVVSLPALPPAVGVATLCLGVAAAALYLRHARLSPAPVLDPRLFRNPAFRAAIAGGSLFRVGIGAIPFLLPLMFQLGFGLTPFQSGMLTFASALGAISMKFIARRLLQAGGFRTVLIGAGLVGAGLIGINAGFRPYTPYALIIAVLIVSGFIRSLFFTSCNALVFADIEDRDAAQATAIAAVSQQISIALGVAVAGLILEAFTNLTGEPLGVPAFSTAFGIVAVLAATAVLPFLRLDPDAGNAVSGHRLERQAVEAQTPAV